MVLINKVKKINNWKEVEVVGLMGFKCDIIWVVVIDMIYDKLFNVDFLRYVLFGNGVQFEMYIKNDIIKLGVFIFLFQVNILYDVYLNGFDK